MKVFKKVFQYGDHEVTLETGGIARQADGAVMVTMGDTVVLATVVGKKSVNPDANFFPLTINYQEKFYASGKIPGGYLKREARPADHETLTSRLIDRPIRPLFPKGFRNEVQVILTVLSLDPEVTPDIPAMIGASAALAVSGLPFDGPIAGARVGFYDGSYLLNPSMEMLKTSQLDLVVAGTHEAVLMVESEAQELPEETMLGAVLFGHQHMQVVIQAINELADVGGKEAWDVELAEEDATLLETMSAACLDNIKAAYALSDKTSRQQALNELKDAVTSDLLGEDLGDSPYSETQISSAFASLEKHHVRSNILEGQLRIDGRDTKTVRPLYIDTSVLPRTHGSALFTRGETQALAVTTLGAMQDAKMTDSIYGDERDTFMLHYNFPSYSVGETGRMMGPGRREIGHGMLAKRALRGVMPGEDFPYTIRVVSEITESNGSSSMASVCGASLSMMDAGVPLKAPVAGIAMGLIKEGDKFAILTDILGDEDHLGDMDFKVAGTAEGITALQMDIKINGITKQIMDIALEQAKAARHHILGLMNEVLSEPRKKMSKHAPQMSIIQIAPEKVREVIGKGGATIKSITESTGVTMDLTDDGKITIFAPSQEATDAATAMVEGIVAEAEVGAVYEGKITRMEDYGAFVNIMPNKDGLVHISQVAQERVEKIHDHLEMGQTVRVKCIDIDRQGRIKLSIRALIEDEAKTTEAAPVAEEASAPAQESETPIEPELQLDLEIAEESVPEKEKESE